MRALLQPFPAALLLALGAMLALLVYGVTSSGPSQTIDDALAQGRRVPAPAVTLPRFSSGAQASLSDYRGQVVVLNFWASWCEPCRDESPLLQRWHDRIGSRGGTVLGALVAEFGDAVLAVPDDEGFNLSAYLVPLLALLAAGAGIGSALVRWRRAGTRAAGFEAVGAAGGLDPDDAVRLDAELRREGR